MFYMPWLMRLATLPFIQISSRHGPARANHSLLTNIGKILYGVLCQWGLSCRVPLYEVGFVNFPLFHFHSPPQSISEHISGDQVAESPHILALQGLR